MSLLTIQDENQKDLVSIEKGSAVSGTRSLRVRDKAGLKAEFNPHFYLDPHYTSGNATLSFDIRLNAGAQVGQEWRDQCSPYRTGPSLLFRDGMLFARDKKVLDVPANTWIHVSISTTLGINDARWSVEVTSPQGKNSMLENLACDPAWKEARWVGFSSHGTDGTSYYLDNLILDCK